MITSEIELFLVACPAKVIGITGTVGKSTTASMLAAIMKESGKTTWLGGNIGHSSARRVAADKSVTMSWFLN